ncbi:MULTISPECIES: phage holin family protein [unclassified Clostridioides]|uniref:phage holin family protein n=1 Tax=unclassified Clostridioides TaxID=2635829 RepID=UPI001D0F901B
MNNLISFIPEQLLLLVVALNVLRFGFKKYKQLYNKYIPVILLILGVGFLVWMLELNADAVL